MRKLIPLLFIMLMTTVVFAQSKKELATEVTSLKAQIAALNAELAELKKVKEADLSDENKKASYGLGVLMASNVKSQGADSLDIESLTLAMRDVLQNKALKLTQQECMPVVQQYMQQAFYKKNEKVKSEGQAFLLKNKTAEGVTTTASGLQYKVLTRGNGKMPVSSDNVTVHYAGRLLDGSEFDSSIGKQPANFRVTGVIQGWVEALQLMREGDKWILYIPYELGYGERGNGTKIPPFSTLVFEIELLKVN